MTYTDNACTHICTHLLSVLEDHDRTADKLHLNLRDARKKVFPSFSENQGHRHFRKPVHFRR